MRIILNGKAQEVSAGRLDTALEELGFSSALVATAVNGNFVPADDRPRTVLQEADRLEIIAPMQGG